MSLRDCRRLCRCNGVSLWRPKRMRIVSIVAICKSVGLSLLLIGMLLLATTTTTVTAWTTTTFSSTTRATKQQMRLATGLLRHNSLRQKGLTPPAKSSPGTTTFATSQGRILNRLLYKTKRENLWHHSLRQELQTAQKSSPCTLAPLYKDVVY
jgi:hypothetical protein